MEANQPTEEEVPLESTLTAGDVVARLTSSSVNVRLESLEKLSNPGTSEGVMDDQSKIKCHFL